MEEIHPARLKGEDSRGNITQKWNPRIADFLGDAPSAPQPPKPHIISHKIRLNNLDSNPQFPRYQSYGKSNGNPYGKPYSQPYSQSYRQQGSRNKRSYYGKSKTGWSENKQKWQSGAWEEEQKRKEQKRKKFNDIIGANNAVKTKDNSQEKCSLEEEIKESQSESKENEIPLSDLDIVVTNTWVPTGIQER